MRVAALVGAVLMVRAGGQLVAQDYLLRLDSRVQAASYRGVQLDSIPLGLVITAPSGGPASPDGFAVHCLGGSAYCQFYRPGGVRRGGPLVAGAELTVWGFGVAGVRLHAAARAATDLGTANAWPGTTPAAELLEGYLEYAGTRITGRIGRQLDHGRLGATGYDGARLFLRETRTGLTGTVFGGLGLARGTALPVTSDALSPLDDFQPSRRQLIVGGSLEWQRPFTDARIDYQREVDRETRNFVAERVAMSATLRPFARWSLSGGAEYDIARGLWGTADLTLRHTGARAGGAIGVRSYRPYFDLWSLWGVFSPVPYHAVNGSLWVRPAARLDLRIGGERYWYSDAEAETPLVSVEERGWRWNAGAGFRLSDAWQVDGGYRAEFGPGAASRGWDGSLTWRPRPSLSLTAQGGHLARPLELRVNDAVLTWVGGSAEWRASDRFRVALAASRYDENRRRPDAAGFDWSQTRLQAGVSWLLGSGADRLPLPPAIRRGAGR